MARNRPVYALGREAMPEDSGYAGFGWGGGRTSALWMETLVHQGCCREKLGDGMEMFAKEISNMASRRSPHRVLCREFSTPISKPTHGRGFSGFEGSLASTSMTRLGTKSSI